MAISPEPLTFHQEQSCESRRQLVSKKKRKKNKNLTQTFKGLGGAHGKEMQKSKMAVWGGLTIAVKRREAKSKGEKERYKHLNAEFQRIARRDKKPSSVINAEK